MAGFLYYLPGRDKGITLEQVKEAGLGHAFSVGFAPCGVAKGPDGRAGVVIAVSRPGLVVGHYPDKQTWQQIPGNDNWFGYYTDNPPKPADLAHEKQLDGHWVRLGDGEKWLIPVARGFTEVDGELRYYVALPQTLGREDGKWVEKDVVPQYARLWALAMICCDGSLDGLGGACDAAAEVLTFNYRGLGLAEIELLGMFTTDTVGKVLGALVDRPAQDEFESKKKREASDANSTSDAGSPDSILDTAPPPAT